MWLNFRFFFHLQNVPDQSPEHYQNKENMLTTVIWQKNGDVKNFLRLSHLDPDFDNILGVNICKISFQPNPNYVNHKRLVTHNKRKIN